MLSNHLSELAIAQWGAGQSEEVKKALGFEKEVTPHQTTMQRLFRKMHVEKLEEAFRALFVHLFEQPQPERGACAVAIDGKAHKGRLKFEEEKSGVNPFCRTERKVNFRVKVCKQPQTQQEADSLN